MRYRHAITLFLFALPVCIMLRTIQLFFTIDEVTGFIKQQYSGISAIMTIVICAAVVVSGALSFSADGVRAKNEKLKPVLAAVSVLTGGMFFFDTIVGTSAYDTDSWHGVLIAILGVLSAVVFAAYGVKNIYHYNMPAMVLIIPVFYHIVRLINIFVSTSSLALTVENIFLLLTNGALLLFMFEFAKFENNIDGGDKRPKKFLGIGISSAMLCGIMSVPKIFLLVAGQTQFSNRDISSVLLVIALGAFVMTFILCNFSDKENFEKRRGGKHLAE